MSVEQVNHSNLIWKISGGLSAMVIVAAAFMYLQNQDDPSVIQDKPPIKRKIPEATTITTPVTDTPDAIRQHHNPLVQDSILKDDIPQDSALAKEEMAKLEDIQDQLVTQQNILKSQQDDAEQLIQIKEEQIKLLEQQLSTQN